MGLKARKANSTDAQPDFSYPSRMREWVSDYIAAEKEALDSISVDEVAQAIDTVKGALKEDRQIFVFGNGGSAPIASHFSMDLTNNSSIKCFNYNDPAIITCYSNDYKFENWISKTIDKYGKKMIY